MNPRPLLSLVMPVYNVAAYLPACLDSVLAQTRLPDEIIIVDDGSTDECPAILAAYAARCPAIRVVRQTNRGLSAARNAGLDLARGEWLAFVDSDDRLAPEHCAHALAMAHTDDLDMALFNGVFDYEGRRPETPIYADDPPAASGITSGAEWMKERLRRRSFLHMVWLHLYRRDFLERIGLRFVPPWIHEDVPWTTRALLAAGRVRYDPRPLVHYRIPVRRFDPEVRDRRLKLTIESSLFNARELDAIAAGVADPELAALLRWQLVDGGLSVFHKIEKLSTSGQRRELRRVLRTAGFYRLLWRHASDWKQRRRIARQWAKAIVAGETAR